jgi:glycosyltransferase involved in cell wall biosynthesis
MIVKNEEGVVARALASVRGLIDRWVVCDTGSTDKTKEVVCCELEGIPGALIEAEWVNFSHNRNVVLKAAEEVADYVLVVDADDVLEVGPGFSKRDLIRDYHYVKAEHGGVSYWKIHLFRSNLGFHYEGVTHEALVTGPTFSHSKLDSIRYLGVSGGSRSDGGVAKFEENIRLLSKEVHKNPRDARSWFYLAMSYRDAGKPLKAVESYHRRISIGGWDEEIFYSHYDRARLLVSLKRDSGDIIAAFLAAYEYRPTRAEPLWSLACYLRETNRIQLAYPFARVAASLPMPEDVLFVEPEVYTWKALDEWAVAAYWQKRKEEAIEACTLLLKSDALPEAHRPRISKNLAFSLALE